MSQPVFFSRQPIFDACLNTYAYQLLTTTASEVNRSETNTADIMVSAYSNIFDNGFVKCLPAWIEVDDVWLLDRQFPVIPVDSLVLELTPSVLSIPELSEILQELTTLGYRICIPDSFDETLYPFAAIVRVTCQVESTAALTANVSALRQQGKFRLLAGDISTFKEYQQYKSVGFDLFSGWFFAEPQLVTGRKLTRNEVVMFQLIGEVNHPDATVESIEQLLQRDPELVASLLRLVNSAAFGGRRAISNIAEAIVTLGLAELKKWVLLFALCHNKQVPGELIELLLTKAKMCELAAGRYSHIDAGTAFMTGILSGIDAVLGIALNDILEQLPVQIEVKRAVLGGNNPLGKLLLEVDTYARGDWSEIPQGEEMRFLADCYSKALSWSGGVLEELT